MDKKLANLINYIIYKCNDDPSKLGSTKLNKILWFCDREVYKRTGKTITKIEYVKIEFGPAPTFSEFQEAIRYLKKNGKIIAKKGEVYYSKPQNQFIALEEADISNFTPEEISIIDTIISIITKNFTASSISKLTHDFHWWDKLDIGDKIPIYSVFANPEEINENDINWAKQKLKIC